MRGRTLRIGGVPVPKARPRFDTRRGRVYTPESTKLAEDLLATLMQLQLVALGPAEVAVEIEFAFSSRRSGDLDNCAKLVLDALQKARVIDNDRQVRQLWINAKDVKKGQEFTWLRLHDLTEPAVVDSLQSQQTGETNP